MAETNKALTDQEMKELLDTFIEAKAEENQYYSSTLGLRPQPGSSATEADLQALDEYLLAKDLYAPTAYKQFLRIYNGVELLLYPLSLYPVSKVIGKHEFIEAMFDEHPGCRDFVIAGGGRLSGDIVAFDVKSKSSNGDYEVVWLTESGGVERDPDFVSFLRAYLKVTEDTIAQEKADRANLKP